jgi:hypothetical protein
MNDDDRTTAIGLFNYARSYWRSGVHLAALNLEVTHPEAPVTFLFYHAIELYLKAYLRSRNLTVKELRDIGHKVTSLAQEARRRGLFLDDEDQDVISLMGETDTIIRSRYIVTGAFSRPAE